MSDSPKLFLTVHWSVPWILSGFIWKNRGGLL
ncbi:Rha family transcriptional regulator [Shigella flexneri]|nr:Rha family transcriptional regulator [Shigella flexneri]